MDQVGGSQVKLKLNLVDFVPEMGDSHEVEN